MAHDIINCKSFPTCLLNKLFNFLSTLFYLTIFAAFCIDDSTGKSPSFLSTNKILCLLPSFNSSSNNTVSWRKIKFIKKLKQ